MVEIRRKKPTTPLVLELQNRSGKRNPLGETLTHLNIKECDQFILVSLLFKEGTYTPECSKPVLGYGAIVQTCYCSKEGKINCRHTCHPGIIE